MTLPVRTGVRADDDIGLESIAPELCPPPPAALPGEAYADGAAEMAIRGGGRMDELPPNDPSPPGPPPLLLASNADAEEDEDANDGGGREFSTPLTKVAPVVPLAVGGGPA